MESISVLPAEESSWRRSRRSFLRVSSAAAVAALGMRILTEPMLARAESHRFPEGAVIIDANENPLGPSAAACHALKSVAVQGGRYSGWMTDELIQTFAAMEGLKPEYVRAFPGSSGPLHYSVLAFTSRPGAMLPRIRAMRPARMQRGFPVRAW